MVAVDLDSETRRKIMQIAHNLRRVMPRDAEQLVVVHLEDADYEVSAEGQIIKRERRVVAWRNP